MLRSVLTRVARRLALQTQTERREHLLDFLPRQLDAGVCGVAGEMVVQRPKVDPAAAALQPSRDCAEIFQDVGCSVDEEARGDAVKLWGMYKVKILERMTALGRLT